MKKQPKQSDDMTNAAARNILEGYTPMEVERNQIQNASYNPRFLTRAARVKLKNSLKNFGLVELPVVNIRTWNIVGGNQRVGEMDREHKDTDYKLMVAAIDVDEDTERRLCLFLNNPEAQGVFDAELVGAMINQLPSIDKTGFDYTTLYMMEVPIAGDEEEEDGDLYKEDPAEELINETVNVIREGQEYQKERDEKRKAEKEEAENAGEPAPLEKAELSDEEIAKIKAAKLQYAVTVAQFNADIEFYTVLLFEDKATMDRFRAMLNLDPDEQFLDGEALFKEFKERIGEAA